jgi:ABC-type branched-subunit amino acid transport system ATPase component
LDSALTKDFLQLEGLGFRPSKSGPFLFSELNLIVQSGEVAGIVGGNGVGKTTLLNIISGLARPSCGRTKLPSPGTVGRSFQGIPIVEGIETWKYIAGIRGIDSRDSPISVGKRLLWEPWAAIFSRKYIKSIYQVERQANAYLDSIGISQGSGDKALDSLSMGVRRVADVLRALFQDTRVLLLDEPFANLREATAKDLAAHIRSAADDDRCVVVVDHDVRLIQGISDSVYRLQRDGLRRI